jgi:hypothetical protein
MYKMHIFLTNFNFLLGIRFGVQVEIVHVHRMNNSRFPKALIEYHPRGRRRPGRPLKRLLDGFQIETETGHMGPIS